jgi:phosphoserine phosphatase
MGIKLKKYNFKILRMAIFVCLNVLLIISCHKNDRYGYPEVYTPETLIQTLQNLNNQKTWDKLEKKGFSKCAIFDADGTLWRGDLSGSIIQEDIKNKKLSNLGLPALNESLTFFGLEPQQTIYAAKDELNRAFKRGYSEGGMYKIAQKLTPPLSKDEVHEKTWNHYNLLYVGLTPQALEEKANSFIKQAFHKQFYKGISSIISYLRKSEFKVYVISAGVHDFTLAGAKLLGFDADKVRGMRLKVVNGIISDKPELPIMYKNGKAQVAKEFCKGKPFIVFGDSVSGTDEKMLEEAYFPVAVEPKPKHASVAKLRNYSILDFKQTVDGQPSDQFVK